LPGIVAQMYVEVKGRLAYTVAERVGFPKAEARCDEPPALAELSQAASS
jgi:hypothetical protein